MKKFWLIVLLVVSCSSATESRAADIWHPSAICTVSNIALGFVMNVLPKGVVDNVSALVLFVGMNGILLKPNVIAIPAYVIGKVAAGIVRRLVYDEENEQQRKTLCKCCDG